MSLPSEVVHALSQLPIIQATLQSMNIKINEISEVKKDVDAFKADIWDDDGIDKRLSYVSQQSEDTSSDIHHLKTENTKLKKEINLLKSAVIRLDRKATEQEHGITELKGRSMRDNILIHNLAEEERENLTVKVPSLIKEHLGLNVAFVRIYRNAPRPYPNGKPRSITGKLVYLTQKEQILSAQRIKLNNKESLPFHITPQSPPQIFENRKKLLDLNKKYRESGTNTRVVGNKLLFPNGNIYKDKVVSPKAEDILSIDDVEMDRLERIELQSSSKFTESGNQFIAKVSKTSTVPQVRNMYKKVASNPNYAKANHRELVYRFTDNAGNVHEGYNDDGEYGAGRKLLKVMQDQNLMDCSFVIIRWFNSHLGPKRFKIMENVMLDAAGKI